MEFFLDLLFYGCQKRATLFLQLLSVGAEQHDDVTIAVVKA